MRRVNYIDWMKALGMFFIIWGHLNPEYIKDCIYTFSVPSFFVISGFLFKPSDWQTFCKKKLGWIDCTLHSSDNICDSFFRFCKDDIWRFELIIFS